MSNHCRISKVIVKRRIPGKGVIRPDGSVFMLTGELATADDENKRYIYTRQSDATVAPT